VTPVGPHLKTILQGPNPPLFSCKPITMEDILTGVGKLMHINANICIGIMNINANMGIKTPL
jgi:hypothetical protein